MDLSMGFGLQEARGRIAERFWESLPEEVKAPYAKSDRSKQNPEYRETREILWEAGGTTPQA